MGRADFFRGVGVLWILRQPDEREFFPVRSANDTKPKPQGDAIWVNDSVATTDRLAYMDGNGKAILRVDNFTNVPFNEKRNTVGSTNALDEETVIHALPLGPDHDTGFVPSWKRILT